MTRLSTLDDEELLRLVRAGDEDAFTEIYNRRQGGVFRYVLHVGGSRQIAEDVTQEVFIVLMSESERYDPSRGSLSAYLYGIARNYVLRRLHRDRMLVQLDDDSNEVDRADQPAFVAPTDPLSDLTRTETIEAVRSAILSLPIHYREAVVLCDLHEVGYSEAANVLGCAVGTVRSRLHRGRGLLVEKLRTSAEPSTTSGEANPERCCASNAMTSIRSS
jgi:RNA polymerase sigma-70 factor (ECF subfamily)